MIDLDSIKSEMIDDIKSVNNYTEKIYAEQFAHYFEGQRELYKRIQSKITPITDEELEWILTSIPLELFSVSEKLSQVKTEQEVIKMRNKQKETELKKLSDQTTETKKKEEADYLLLENRLLLTVYTSVISRVENEISFSRELVMAAKKIFDARRNTLEASPISPVNTAKTYINNNTVPDNKNLPEFRPVM